MMRRESAVLGVVCCYIVRLFLGQTGRQRCLKQYDVALARSAV
jgi:hypothetical protein